MTSSSVKEGERERLLSGADAGGGAGRGSYSDSGSYEPPITQYNYRNKLDFFTQSKLTFCDTLTGIKEYNSDPLLRNMIIGILGEKIMKLYLRSEIEYKDIVSLMHDSTVRTLDGGRVVEIARLFKGDLESILSGTRRPLPDIAPLQMIERLLDIAYALSPGPYSFQFIIDSLSKEVLKTEANHLDDIILTLLNEGINDFSPEDKQKLFFRACKINKVKLVDRLLEDNPALISSLTLNGFNGLSIAADSDTDCFDTCYYLIKRGIDINNEVDGLTALHCSVKKSSNEISLLLVTAEAKVNSFNENYNSVRHAYFKSPLACSLASGEYKMAQTLIAFGATLDPSEINHVSDFYKKSPEFKLSEFIETYKSLEKFSKNDGEKAAVKAAAISAAEELKRLTDLKFEGMALRDTRRIMGVGPSARGVMTRFPDGASAVGAFTHGGGAGAAAGGGAGAGAPRHPASLLQRFAGLFRK